MGFLEPANLVALAIAPALVVLRWRLLAVRRSNVVDYPGLAVARAAQAARWRLHVPPLLFLLGLVVLLLAWARPVAQLRVPSLEHTVVLVMDVSGSMGAADVVPTRLVAAQRAAKSFVQRLPPGARVGVVAYGGSAHIVQRPTGDRASVLRAIDGFYLQRGTAIGSGIAVGLAALFPEAGDEIARLTAAIARRERAGMVPVDSPVMELLRATGSFRAGSLVLLSDGENTQGPHPRRVAELAARFGVRVFTVGFGSATGATASYGGWAMRVALDEAALQEIAETTGAEYQHASDEADLSAVYRKLERRLVFRTEEVEVTHLFAVAGTLLLVLAAVLSTWWHARLI